MLGWCKGCNYKGGHRMPSQLDENWVCVLLVQLAPKQ